MSCRQEKTFQKIHKLVSTLKKSCSEVIELVLHAVLSLKRQTKFKGLDTVSVPTESRSTAFLA